MKRRTVLAGLAAAAALVAASPALALSYTDDIVAQLTSMGFTDIDIETTWLGRVKIVASRGDGIREIVLNPRTGEILRDVWTPASGDQMPRRLLDDVDGDQDDDGPGDDNGGDRDDDKNDDRGNDDRDDDKDDDNSGPGGGGRDDDRGDDDKNDDRSGKDDRKDD